MTSRADSTISLPAGYILPSSLQLQIDSQLTLRAVKDYQFDAMHNRLVFSNSVLDLLFPSGHQAQHLLSVRYQRLPIQLPRSFTLYQQDRPSLVDSLLDSTHALRQLTKAGSDTAGPLLRNFQKSGSISRGFQVGSNRDVSLTSGFNLQFSGDLADDVSVTGALNEESTPIQPEGTTQSIQDIDRIFITLNASKHFHATLGDFDLALNTPNASPSNNDAAVTGGVGSPSMADLSRSVFDVVQRKLLGAEATVQYNTSALTVLGASARGEHTTNIFQGQEGVQGPYRLTGKNGEPAIIIVAGSERVYVNGVLQVRGERNDYVIDYSLGEINFQPRRLISSDSRITVDFQYSGQSYSRSLIAANTTTSLWKGKMQLAATYIREGDDPDGPLNLSLTDSDRTAIANARNNSYGAARTGVSYAGRDSLGRARGSYIKVDSMISGVPVTVYVYAPLDTMQSLYNVSFGYVGTNHGNYSRQAIGQYSYVGGSLGDYDTLQYLPLPELNQILGLHLIAQPLQSLGISAELATSAYDQNRLSGLPSLIDRAYRIQTVYADTLHSLGYVSFSAMSRNVGDNFHSADRTQPVEFLRQYGNDQADVSAGSDVGTSNSIAQLLYEPVRGLLVNLSYGDLQQRLVGFSSDRFVSSAQLLQDSGWRPQLQGAYEHLVTRDTGLGNKATWIRESAAISKAIHIHATTGAIGVGASYEEKRAIPMNSMSIDSLTSASFRSTTISPSLDLRASNWLSLHSDIAFRQDDSARAGYFVGIATSNTANADIHLSSNSGISASIEASIRNREYIDSIARVGAGGNQETKLIRLEPRYNLSGGGLTVDGLYEISDQRSAKLERVFLPVQKGYGSYRWLGDLNGNGKQDPNEFELARYPDEALYALVTVPTEELYPVTALRANARLRINPSNFFHDPDRNGSPLASVLSNLSSESYIELNETSRDPNPSDIYYLRTSHFLNPETTVTGSYDFEEDIGVLETNPIHSYRLHFLERKNAGQYNTGLEESYYAERSLRIRLHPSFEFLGETILQTTTDIASSDSLSLTRPHNTAMTGFSTDWTYHPIGSAFDYSLRAEVGQAVERSLSPALSAFMDALTFRMSYALQSRTRLRASIERDEVTISGSVPDGYAIPYSLTEGRSVGITWVWQASLDYQFASGIVLTFQYDGRNEPTLGSSTDRQTIHNLSAEVRASF